MADWANLFKIFNFAFEQDPVSKKSKNKERRGAGFSHPDAQPHIRPDGSFSGGERALLPLRDSNDFIDLSTVNNRQSRYKEYERLRNVAEIEQAMTLYADEACVAGTTRIATPLYGLKAISWLAENLKDEEFLVYCWDFERKDYGLGWAFNPRFVKKAETIRIILDDGNSLICTSDHRVLKRDHTWCEAGNLKVSNELMPFYRRPADIDINDKIKEKQFPRIFTFGYGWIHERQFIDEWKTGKYDEKYKLFNKIMRAIKDTDTHEQVCEAIGKDRFKVNKCLWGEGFNYQEAKTLGRKSDRRRIIGIKPYKTVDVYDLSVRGHENFCTDCVVVHNCQRGENGHVFEIQTKNEEIKKELEFLFFHRKMLNIDRRMNNLFKKLCIMGDLFLENIVDPEEPKKGVIKITELPADTMYRIETVRGRTIEFQQSKEGVDAQSLTRAEVTKATDAEILQSTAIRFTPEQITHIKIGDDRKLFYPYGQSLIEPARGPAHQLRLIEDSMVVYRLCVGGYTRIRTQSGWKYIKDIKSGDLVYSFARNTKTTALSPVLWQSSQGVQQTYKIRSKHIEIIANETHPILVDRNGFLKYVSVKELKLKSDRLVNVTNNSNEQTPIATIFSEKRAKLSPLQKKQFRKSKNIANIAGIVRTLECKKSKVKNFLYKDGVSLPYNTAVTICKNLEMKQSELIVMDKGQVHCERIRVPEFVDEDFARLFGFLLGDGSIDQNRLVFAGGNDKNTNKFYKNLLVKFFGRVKFYTDKRSNKHIGNYVVCSKTACNILLSLGYIPGAENKRIPEWVFRSPINIRKALILGLADADAHIRYLKTGLWTAEFEMCNRKLIEDIKELWHGSGLSSGHIRHRSRCGGHEIKPGRRMKPTKSWYVYISSKPLQESEKLLSIESAGEVEVFDISVEHEAHNFIANGCPISNSRAPERRIFYIDINTLPSNKAEAFVERLKDQFRKRKVGGRGSMNNAVEEKYHAPAVDEDIWLPIRGNSQTKVDTLPGAANLDQIDDCLYFRNKLLIALGLPRNYFANEDPQVTRISLSAQDVRFARLVERLQMSMEDGLYQIAEIHLELRGFPEEAYEDLSLKMTPPSDWRELSKLEITSARINNANSLKSSMLLSDYDVLTKWLKYSEEDAQEIIARMKIQKLEDLRLQIMAQNPQLLGIGSPVGEGETEIGVEAGGPNPMLGPPGAEMPQPGMETQPGDGQQTPLGGTGGGGGAILPEPEDEDIKKYDLEIQDYAEEEDTEEVDWSELG